MDIIFELPITDLVGNVFDPPGCIADGSRISYIEGIDGHGKAMTFGPAGLQALRGINELLPHERHQTFPRESDGHLRIIQDHGTAHVQLVSM